MTTHLDPYRNEFSSLDLDSLYDELFRLATNDGDAYRDSRNTKVAAGRAIAEVQKRLREEVRSLFLLRDKLAADTADFWNQP